jgi:hypothetical protein
VIFGRRSAHIDVLDSRMALSMRRTGRSVEPHSTTPARRATIVKALAEILSLSR